MTGPTRADGTPIEVLLVEDDPGDVLMTQEAFEEHKVGNRLTVVADGVEALAYLRREGQYADAPRPGAESKTVEDVAYGLVVSRDPGRRRRRPGQH